MCGIYGHLKKKGKEHPIDVCLKGLKRLEYRGYDSAGVATLCNGEILTYKTVGKVAMLDEQLKDNRKELSIAIAHTRWATHGKLSEENAHPHYDQDHSIALVHNGIVENYLEIKKNLEKKGFKFCSETDTEVISQLIASNYRGNIRIAVRKSLKMIKGSFAIALIHKNHPNVIIAATRSSPLVIGLCNKTKDVFLSSDPSAFYGRSLDIFYLSDNELSVITPRFIHVYNEEGIKLTKETEHFTLEGAAASKEGYEHFMRKEIFEQPDAVQKTLEERYNPAGKVVEMHDFTLTQKQIQSIRSIYILACGTSYHAGLLVADFMQKCLNIATSVFIASEFRYSHPVVDNNTLVIAVSQSGETADTLAALREASKQRPLTIGITNAPHSLLARSVNCVLLTKANSEISVCSTKTFSCQLALLYLLTLKLYTERGGETKSSQYYLKELLKVPSYIALALSQEKAIITLTEKYKHYTSFFFIGRKYMYPTALEAALKLKEITYLQATAYPAGEMKHGPIALIDGQLPTIAFCGCKELQEKMASNLMEIKARGGPILAFAPKDSEIISSVATDFLSLPDSISDEFASIPYSVLGQLFAYHLARILGKDIDQPRNLAKSVTVE